MGAPWKHKLNFLLGRSPEYIVSESPSEKNNNLWIIEVRYKKRRLGTGSGTSKREAEQDAARVAYEASPQNPQRIRELITELAEERGHYSEDRVAHAFQGETAGLPPWFQSIKKAPRELDRRGIDFIVETTDMGSLWLQVKSSARGAREFLREKGTRPIALVVVRVEASELSLRNTILTALIILRNDILRRRQAS